MAKKSLAIVTGGSRGIGYAIAKELANMKYDLLLIAKDQTRLEKSAVGLASTYKVNVDCFSCDISDPNSIDEFYKYVVSKKLIPDVLVNNAANTAAINALTTVFVGKKGA